MRAGRDDVPAADPLVLGRLLAAQTLLPVLPTAQRVAEFYADALTSVPGVSATRVCLVGGASTAGQAGIDRCHTCPGAEGGGPEAGEDGGPLPFGARCALPPGARLRVMPLHTAVAGYGFLVLLLADPAVFDRYEPFIANLGSFLALALENRAQQHHLEQARDTLERRVEERTEELKAANANLEAQIEDRRRAEELVRQLNQQLEHRVEERTAQLQAANRELEAFAYSVSHDLRAPLRHVSGFAGLLTERVGDSLDEEAKHDLDAISDAAGRMGQLINDLLSFSRMGRNEFSAVPVDLGVLVRDVLQELERDQEGRVVRWQIAPLPVVIGDEAMLRVVFVNLITNALKFTRPRPVAEIEIGVRTQDPDLGGAGSGGPAPREGRQVVVFVRDNGVGFDMAQADRLFGVFERLSHGPESFEGTGIGLANVRRVVTRHGGRVWAEGVVGHGATFCVSLPAPE